MFSIANAVVLYCTTKKTPHPGTGLWPDGGSVPGLAACFGLPSSSTVGKAVVHTEGQGCSLGPHGFSSMKRQ